MVPTIRQIVEFCAERKQHFTSVGQNYKPAGSRNFYLGEAAGHADVLAFIGPLPEKLPAGEPPDELWLQWEHEDAEFGVTWCSDPINDEDVLYVRHTDDPAPAAASHGELPLSPTVEGFEGIRTYVTLDGKFAVRIGEMPKPIREGLAEYVATWHLTCPTVEGAAVQDYIYLEGLERYLNHLSSWEQ